MYLTQYVEKSKLHSVIISTAVFIQAYMKGTVLNYTTSKNPTGSVAVTYMVMLNGTDAYSIFLEDRVVLSS